MRRSQREVRFEVQRGHLVRHVKLKDGRSYSHRCTLAALQEVAWTIEERADSGVTTNELWEALPDVPCTQASLALAFMKDRGCVVTESRRCYPASGALFEDVMIEFHVLIEAAESASTAGA